MGKLEGKKVAVLVTDGFEQVELTSPVKRLKEEGADVSIVSLKGGSVKGWDKTDWGEEVESDLRVAEANANLFDALVLPGGVMNPDKLRMDKDAVSFVRTFVESGKPVASICHGPWTLVEAGVVDGRRMTSYPSIRTDLTNAGADWVDEEVVVDRGLVTSRNPGDLPAFNDKMVEEFAEGVHEGRGADASARDRRAVATG